jgi:hypothetical protein
VAPIRSEDETGLDPADGDCQFPRIPSFVQNGRARELQCAERYLKRYMQARVAGLVLIVMAGCGQPPSYNTVMTVCQLSRDFTAYRNPTDP